MGGKKVELEYYGNCITQCIRSITYREVINGLYNMGKEMASFVLSVSNRKHAVVVGVHMVTGMRGLQS